MVYLVVSPKQKNCTAYLLLLDRPFFKIQHKSPCSEGTLQTTLEADQDVEGICASLRYKALVSWLGSKIIPSWLLADNQLLLHKQTESGNSPNSYHWTSTSVLHKLWTLLARPKTQPDACNQNPESNMTITKACKDLLSFPGADQVSVRFRELRALHALKRHSPCFTTKKTRTA